MKSLILSLAVFTSVAGFADEVVKPKCQEIRVDHAQTETKGSDLAGPDVKIEIESTEQTQNV